MRLTLRPNLRSYDLIRRLGALAPPVPSAPVLSGGAITQVDADLVLVAPFASGYPAPSVSLVSLTRDLVDVTADLIGLMLPNFVTGAYVANWSATNSEGSDTRAISGSFTAPAIAPSFASGPTVSGTPATGETLTLAFTSAGTAPITEAIRWLKNGVEVPGETGLTYLLGTVASLDAFRAEVSLTNAADTTGFVASNTLTVPDIGTIEGTPVSILDFGVATDDTLELVVTRGSYTATVGTIIEPVLIEFSLNGGAWAEYPLTTVLTHPGSWMVRETPVSTSGATETFTAGPMTVVGAAASAPAIISHADTTQGTSGSNPVINLPPVYAAGNLLLAVVGQDGNTQALSPTAGWDILHEQLIGANYRRGVLSRVATGSDADPVSDALTMTVAGEIVSVKVVALPTGAIPTIGTRNAGGTALPLVYGSAAPTLWLNFPTHSGAPAGSQVDDGTPPTGYSFVGNMVQGTTTSSSVAVHLAEKTSNATSDAPDSFSNTAGADFNTQLIGVRF